MIPGGYAQVLADYTEEKGSDGELITERETLFRIDQRARIL